MTISSPVALASFRKCFRNDDAYGAPFTPPTITRLIVHPSGEYGLTHPQFAALHDAVGGGAVWVVFGPPEPGGDAAWGGLPCFSVDGVDEYRTLTDRPDWVFQPLSLVDPAGEWALLASETEHALLAATRPLDLGERLGGNAVGMALSLARRFRDEASRQGVSSQHADWVPGLLDACFGSARGSALWREAQRP